MFLACFIDVIIVNCELWYECARLTSYESLIKLDINIFCIYDFPFSGCKNSPFVVIGKGAMVICDG